MGGAKAPGLKDRKWANIDLILTYLRSFNRGSFRTSPQAKFSAFLGIDESGFFGSRVPSQHFVAVGEAPEPVDDFFIFLGIAEEVFIVFFLRLGGLFHKFMVLVYRDPLDVFAFGMLQRKVEDGALDG